MKKTLATLLFATGIAFGADVASSYGSFQKVNNVVAPFTLGDGVTATLTYGTSGVYTRPNNGLTWSNTTALSVMNEDLGLTGTSAITAGTVSYFTRPGDQGAKGVCTLDFTASNAYKAGDSITLYFVAGYATGSGTLTPDIAGLTEITLAYASATGSGFDASGIPGTTVEQTLPTLVKLTGTLGTDRTVTIQDADVAKFGVGMVALKGVTDPTTGGQIPEPTTATLSLLALAGLCARRRRK